MKNNELLNIKNDYVFKRIFGHKGNEELTKSLLEEITKTKINKIELAEEVNLGKNLMDDKIGILDIKAVIDGKIETDIEMQVAKSKDIIPRMLFYWSKMYTSTINSGEKYEKLRKTIIVLIADFELDELEGIENYYTKWKIKDDQGSNAVLTNDLEIYIIELPKYKGTHDNKLDLWVKFIKDYKEMEEFEMEDEVRKAYECLKEISKDKEERRLAELREKYIWEMNSAEKYGEEKGVKIGEKRGEEKGAKEKQKEIAKNMLGLKIDIPVIAKATGLTIEEIEKLQ